MECELCEKRSAVLDFNRTCCRVRFVMSLPSREQRAGWLERWREQDGPAMAEEVVAMGRTADDMQEAA